MFNSVAYENGIYDKINEIVGIQVIKGRNLHKFQTNDLKDERLVYKIISINQQPQIREHWTYDDGEDMFISKIDTVWRINLSFNFYGKVDMLDKVEKLYAKTTNPYWICEEFTGALKGKSPIRDLSGYAGSFHEYRYNFDVSIDVNSDDITKYYTIEQVEVDYGIK